ncbi:MAG TPA: hypothetical protein VNM39_10720 [Verrucomicrobiae bacterium]|nr:hypothetical protein [Verrucomicrobiae bacterium]
MPETLEDVLNNATNDEVEIDFSGAVDFAPVPAGEYDAVIKTVEPKAAGASAKNPGAPLAKFEFVVTEEGPAHNRHFFVYASLTGAGAGRTKEILRAIGVPVEGDKIRFKLSNAVGQPVRLVILNLGEDAEYPNEVKKVKPFVAKAGVPGLDD